MKRMLPAATGAALVVLAVTSSVADAATPTIIGGSQAQNPGYIARFESSVYCTSSLIADRWILTARHCAAEDDNITFYIGSNDAEGGTEAHSTAVHLYPDGDLALVEIDRSGGAQTASLADDDPATGSSATVYGWGATEHVDTSQEGNYQSPTLKQARVTDVTPTPGGDAFGGTSLHANTPQGAVAGGDSGGPMVIDGVVVGVASTSDRESSTDYASVAEARQWIRQVAGV